MIKEALEYLIGLKRPETIEVDRRQYAVVSGGLKPIHEPLPDAIAVHTLTGMAAYIKDHQDDLPVLSGLLLCVDSPTKVSLVSHAFGPFAQRRICAVATTQHDEFPFGRFLPQEEFVIALMSRFEQTDMTRQILKVVGNLALDASVKVEDDGVTQQVEVRQGVRRLEASIENPITLNPYRTFIEVPQPDCKLVLRIKKDKDGVAPLCALYEADGGLWKNAAAENVAAWLRANVDGVSVLA